ncbi:acyl-CoA dehydrogenase family protein [Haliea sp. E1-2-M8]|uniref:acyl-CoA dehydrogenase family protein n=1 Tax=Haliea sp. E1-2-M8 TaxID=3064706 RepID=UPI0027227D3F|nr:acyl-CoA dehydrogenase family protein [Haliea sp. E1-2-M8]MDO8864003.1 acyl-CoA dehydrogenase family protein [Haliea sp. E1-2-M8]
MVQPRNFGFGEDEKALKEVAHAFFRDKFPTDRLHRLVASNWKQEQESECYWDRSLWQEIVELGWLTIAVPERLGGAGMSTVAVAGLIEEAGRAALPSPLISTLSACYILDACATEGADLALALVVDGKTFSFASGDRYGSWENETCDISVSDGVLNGTAWFVQEARKADYFLVKAKSELGLGLYVMPANTPGVNICADKIIDLTRDQAHIVFDNVRYDDVQVVAAPGEAVAALQSATPAMLTILSADMCGAAEWQLQTTVEYARSRVQFDRPIGFFQAVKHPLVDFMTEIDQSRALTYNAACAIDHEPEMAEQFARMAKAAATDAVGYGSRISVQLHGGIGFTWECFVHLYMKRQLHSQFILGDAAYQRAKLGALVLA